MLKRGIHGEGACVLILGLTFTENCVNMRNARVVDVIAELKDYGITVDVHDSWADPDEAMTEYRIRVITSPEAGTDDGVVLAVAHDGFRKKKERRSRADSEMSVTCSMISNMSSPLLKAICVYDAVETSPLAA